MDRWNSEGVARNDLHWILKRPDIVLDRRKRGVCMLCSGKPINEACLCNICVTLLNDEELKLVELWTQGVMP